MENIVNWIWFMGGGTAGALIGALAVYLGAVRPHRQAMAKIKPKDVLFRQRGRGNPSVAAEVGLGEWQAPPARVSRARMDRRHREV